MKKTGNSKEHKSPAGKAGGRAVGGGRILRVLWFVAGCLVGVGSVGLILGRTGDDTQDEGRIQAMFDTSCRNKEIQVGKPGPWGQLEVRPIVLSPARQVSRASQCPVVPGTWVLPVSDVAAVDAWLAARGMSESLRAAGLSRVQCGNGYCGLVPELSWLRSIPGETRARVYADLDFQLNPWVNDGIRGRREVFEDNLAASTLPQETKDLVRQLLFFWDGDTVFIDSAAVCATLDTPGRIEMVRFLHMERGLIVRLRIQEGQDVSGIVRYWSRGEFGRELKGLLESLSRRPGGGSIDILNLLPPVPRTLLNTYSEFLDDPRDCHWSGMNFLEPTADDRFLAKEWIEQELSEHYVQVQTPPLLGDLYHFAMPSGLIGHTAVHIADDIVFTKNGASSAQPWVLARLGSVIEQYASLHGSQVIRMRRTNLP